jgi:hypothetical protein
MEGNIMLVEIAMGGTTITVLTWLFFRQKAREMIWG